VIAVVVVAFTLVAVEWRSGGVEEWRSGGVEEWRSGMSRQTRERHAWADQSFFFVCILSDYEL
jgi:hypothetical protein